MNSIPLWVVHPPPPLNLRSRLESTQPRSDSQKSKWFRHTSYISSEKSISRQQSRLNKLLQSIMSNATNLLIQTYKEIIEDLDQVPNVRIRMLQQQSLLKTKTTIIQSNMDKIIKQGISKNLAIQRQQDHYSQTYRLGTQSHCNDQQNQQSIFVKSLSTHIQSQGKVESGNNSSRFFKTIRGSQGVGNKEKGLGLGWKKGEKEEEGKWNRGGSEGRKNSGVNSESKGQINSLDEKDRTIQHRLSINTKQLRAGPQTNNPQQIIFKSRKAKQCTSKVLQSRKIQLALQEQGLIKLIQNKIENDCFGLILTNKSVYKKRMRTFYKG